MINNKLTILVGKDGRPSMKGVYSKMENSSELHVRRKLVKKKGIVEYFRIYTNHNSNAFVKTPIQNNDLTNKIVVRWGNTIQVNLTNSIVYNKAEAISNGCNKKKSRKIFIAKGVNTPKLIKSAADIQQSDFPIIARPSKHSKGKNFVILNNLNQYEVHKNNHIDWYYSAFVDKVKEYRLHVAHGRILNYLEKPKPADGNIAWNRAQNGEAFENVKWDEYDTDICMEAIKAVQALELDFAGVDVMVDKDGKVFILEVNTAATLASSEYSMQRYAKYFDWLCKDNKRREHWELKEFKKASNYAWHDYHFEDRDPNKK
jgi:glutathione synthase/RimK-type ligase-like ATP-grasp enzyme